MSADRLASRLREVARESAPLKPDDPDARRIEAMQKALDNTTVLHPGTPWDGEHEEEETEKGIWIQGTGE